jgi:hypothetical protein
MELFNLTGFEIQDKVFVILSDIKYFGKVIDTDERLDRIKVDFTAKSDTPAVGWFHKSFWKKEE